MEQTYYFPWVRKGLSNKIEEKDQLGSLSGDTSKLAKQRPVLSITAEYELTSPPVIGEKKVEVPPLPQTETKEIQFVSPGDILRLNPNAILKMAPDKGTAGFPVQYFPYIEFWEPDFLWRYTPVNPNDNKLRPWLTLLVCKKEDCRIEQFGDGRSYVAFKIRDNEHYEQIFISPCDIWKTAHAQGMDKSEPEFSRLIALRRPNPKDDDEKYNLEKDTDYVAFLVPSFETGRLRGLGCEDDVLKDIIAQKPAWEESYSDQKNKQRAFDFPVYFSWNFTTGKDSFDGLVKKLTIAGGSNSENKIDVTRMGEGLDYNYWDTDARPKRKVIGMPAATKTFNYEVGVPFPSAVDITDKDVVNESKIYENLKNLISKNPVFLENELEISGNAGKVQLGDDDPWVVPPVYGGKHIMATSVDEQNNLNNNTPWLSQVNLDIHYRSAAGLGKRTVQIHQEEFVNRAWKQVEAVNALNHELYKRLLSISVNESLQSKVFGDNESYGAAFIAQMMRKLGTMIKAQTESGYSIADILEKSNIPKAFATASFQRNMERVSKYVAGLNPDTVMDNIAKNQIFRLSEHVVDKTPSLEQLRKTADRIYVVLFEEICRTLSKYFDIKKRTNVPHVDFEDLYQLVSKNINPPLSYPSNLDFYYDNPDLDAFLSRYSVSNPIMYEHYQYCGYTTEQFELKNVTSHSSYFVFKSPTVLMLDDNEYMNMFGSEKILTRVGGVSGIYFISKSGLKHIVKLDDNKPLFQFWVTVRSRTNPNGKQGQWYWASTNYLTKVFFDLDTGNLYPDATVNPSQNFRVEGHYYFQLYEDNISPHHIQSFNTLYEYVEFLKEAPIEMNTYLNEWIQLDACVKHLETEKAQRGDTEEKETEIDETAVGALQNEMDFEEEYERIRDVAERYYENFFHPNIGEELRNKYIEELLLSKYPILAYPIFPEPVYHYLKMFADKFIIPCIDELPDDSIAMFMSNEEFTEAYLCGMNTEMGRELLWREYPTDQRGSYFRKFWDSETSTEDIHNENFFDIKPLHTWKGFLGENHAESKTGLMLFAIKGTLMRQYPTTRVYLYRAVDLGEKNENNRIKLEFDKNATEDNGGIIPPIIQAFFREDIYLVGFKKSFEQLLGNPKEGKYGYFLAFEEDVQDLNFQDDPINDNMDAAAIANELKNDPTIVGKHVSLFIINKSEQKAI